MAEPTHIPKIVEKPWGREIWYADQAAYAGKVLEAAGFTRVINVTEGTSPHRALQF